MTGVIPSPVDLPDPGIELGSPALQADSLPAELPGKPLESQVVSNSFLPKTRETNALGLLGMEAFFVFLSLWTRLQPPGPSMTFKEQNSC